jgi:hypothetical protein
MTPYWVLGISPGLALPAISLRYGSTNMYVSHHAKMLKRAQNHRDGIERECFKQMDGLRELWPNLTLSQRGQHISRLLSGTKEIIWWACSKFTNTR